jgi:hypothetical protein
MDSEAEVKESAAGPEKEAGREIRVLACIGCDGPVPSNAPKCATCGAPLTGKEFPYVARSAAGPDIVGMVKWWGILSVVIFALGGFSFGIGSSLAFTLLSLVYAIRILRAYFL